MSALEQRLRTLIASERQEQELLEKLLEQQLTAQQEDSARRLAALEGALAEARIEATKRAETEQVVGAMRTEASRLTNELEQAKQVAADARNAEKALVALRTELERQRGKVGELERLRKQHTETERRIAELEAELGRARGNVAQERAQRTELEQQLGQVRSGASRLATELEQTRKGAEDARKARSKEARRIEEDESKLVALRAEFERERQKREELEQQVESLTTHEEHLGEARGNGPAPAESSRWIVDRPAAATHGVIDGVLRRRFRREPGHLPSKRADTCVVCDRSRTADGHDSDWIIRAGLGLCPDCRGDGWQLPEGGGGMPFRRLSDKQRRVQSSGSATGD